MAHSITALIGLPEALAAIAELFDGPKPVGLPYGLQLVGLDEGRLDRLSGVDDQPSMEGFIYLTAKVAEGLGATLGPGQALYIETDYFGGTGGQAAALFEGGQLVWSGACSDFDDADPPEKTPISEGLSRLGVAPAAESDEFDAVELWRYRSLDDLGFDG